jgi:hypothetical protein
LSIFISYSHSDAAFVNRLATALVESNTHVWVDSWELNVGDSILDRVQAAMKESDALLIVLSKASVASDWCRKELNAGLMRELDEKRVLVLPVLVEDCDVPMFLREKKYADFRIAFADGFKALVEATLRVTSLDQGRVKSNNTYTDWAETWTYDDELFTIEYRLIEFSPDLPFTILAEIRVHLNEASTRRYRKYETADLGWVGRSIITEALADLAESDDIRIRLEDQHPQFTEFVISDPKRGFGYFVIIRCQRLGQDNGKDQLINIGNYLKQIRKHFRKIARNLTPEEAARVQEIISRPE